MTRLGLIEGTVVLAWCVEAAILVGWGLLVRELEDRPLVVPRVSGYARMGPFFDRMQNLEDLAFRQEGVVLAAVTVLTMIYEKDETRAWVLALWDALARVGKVAPRDGLHHAPGCAANRFHMAIPVGGVTGWCHCTARATALTAGIDPGDGGPAMAVDVERIMRLRAAETP
jgi:hypothetical protein